MIPKKIHFIWLGGGNFDKQSLICVNSAKRILSNYQIVIWTEKNLDLEKIANENKFLRECLKRKLWAFVSDYLRLYILYHYGGIYLDTDVQIIKPFSKEMLSKNFFAGLEDRDFVGTGVIGAEKNSQIIQRLLEFYEKEIWKVNYFNNPIIFKHVFPQTISTIIVYITMNIGGAIISAASLSFLGLGAPPSSPEWGAMLSASRDYIGHAFHLIFFPGFAVFLTVLALNLFGDGLRDVLDPKTRD